MEKHIGLLDTIWIYTLNPLVIRFTVETTAERIHCSLSNSELADKILFLPNRDYTVEVTGETDSNGLFFVSNIKIRNPDRTTKKLGL